MQGQKYIVNKFTDLLKSLKGFSVYFNLFFRLLVEPKSLHLLSVLDLLTTRMLPKYKTLAGISQQNVQYVFKYNEDVLRFNPVKCLIADSKTRDRCGHPALSAPY